jgi:hypothetical protein
MVMRPELDLYVTWPSLENSLKGIKDALDSALNKQEQAIKMQDQYEKLQQDQEEAILEDLIDEPELTQEKDIYTQTVI